MKKSLLILICAVASAYAVSERVKNVRENLGSNRIVEVSLGSEHHKLLAEYGSDQLQVNTDRSTTTFRVGEEELELLSKFGQEFEDMTEEFIQLHEDRFNGLHEDFRFCTEGAACAKRKAEDFYAEYQPLESLWERMEDIVEESCIAKIDSVGESYEGRDQKTIVIENKGGKKKKPLVFYFCNIHAREWLTPMYCMHMAETLLTGGISGEPHYLTVIYDFTILVSANPDGYKFSWTDDNMWRKTRMPNNGTDCVGTDPNRNWDFVFGGTDSSSDPCSNTYCGVEPFDQPEVANIAAYVKKNQHRLINVNDVHSPFTCWFSPYSGYRDTPPQKDYDLQMMCAEAAIDAIEEKKKPNPHRTSSPTSVWKDKVPSGITYSDESPAPCPENVDYCYISYINENCPVTYNSCPREIPEASISSLYTANAISIDLDQEEVLLRPGVFTLIGGSAIVVRGVIMRVMKWR
eukprot:augustus_masked-scaffold_10-processed-gene-7.35-mRNA-1 protein AED:1.00 eAED:1.00 QI:0/0/0/0/1/1/2/0/461